MLKITIRGFTEFLFSREKHPPKGYFQVDFGCKNKTLSGFRLSSCYPSDTQESGRECCKQPDRNTNISCINHEFTKNRPNQPEARTYYQRNKQYSRLRAKKPNQRQECSNPPPARLSAIVTNCEAPRSHNLYQGQLVKVCSKKPQTAFHDGFAGKICAITRGGIVFVGFSGEAESSAFDLDEIIALEEGSA